MAKQTPWQALDVLSPPARAVVEAHPEAYSRLVVRGDGSTDIREKLFQLRPEGLLTLPVRSPDDAGAMLAGLWLWHDWLDESHTISQSLHNATGSFWHAMMHRREGDFSNSKYWYARCRNHPVIGEIPDLVRDQLGAAATQGPLHQVLGDRWDPDGFVDVVEAVHRDNHDPLYAPAVQLQRIEWQALFAFCAKKAAGVD